MKKIFLLLVVIIILVLGLALIEYFRLGKMFQMEQNLIKTQASIVLDELLTVELIRSSIERQDLLEREGLLMNREGWGSSYEEKTITAYAVYPVKKKNVWEFTTENEWFESTKEKYGMYQISGMNFERLDTAFSVALQSKGISLPYVIAIRDSLHNILKQRPSDIDYANYQLSLDEIRLDIGSKDFLVLRFDESRLVMFRQTRNMLFTSLGIALLFAMILFYMFYTLYYQIKTAVEKEQFSKGIVHDLRKPVSFIKSILTDIRNGENLQKHVQDMEFENERLSMMIENLLCTSVTKQTQFIQKNVVSLFDYLNDIVKRYKMHDETIHITLSCYDTSLTANIDPFHIGNAMMNLIENAIKYSIGKPEIFVGCYSKDNFIHITVKDRGIGIPKRYIRHIFKKHFRIPQLDSIARDGFGLGLYYVKIVAKKHGGDVSVKSEHKKGSEFTITIPSESITHFIEEN